MKVGIFCFDEFPIRSTITHDLSPAGPLLAGPDLEARLGDFRVVWNRRGLDPKFAPALDPEDRGKVSSICRRYCDEMRLTPPAGQIWINSRETQLRMRSKALQLAIARRLGFEIPETVITNDPSIARAFVSRPGDYIVKSIAPLSWDEDGKTVAVFTTQITRAELDDDVSVQSCPMIYQKRIEKAFELRVLVFGPKILWVKIDSQVAGRYEIDWRYGVDQDLKLEAFTPSRDLEARLLAFCSETGLLHASFDLAVARDGTPIFFEVNEQGQTLWIETVNPDLPVLAHLTEFLWRTATGDAPPWGEERIRLADYLPVPEA